MVMKLKDEFKINLAKRMLIDYFLQDKKRSLLAKECLENYRYTKKYKAGYILLYKHNIYKANMNIINIFYNKLLNAQDKQILNMRYKGQRTFLNIATILQIDSSVVFNRHKNILIILASIMLTEVNFDDEYMMSPEILTIMETRIVIEASYVMLGENLSNSNEQIKKRIEVEEYLELLKKKQEKIIRIRSLVLKYLDDLLRENKDLEYRVINETFMDYNIKRDAIGKKLYVSSSRVVQMINKFKKSIRINYLKGQ